MKVGSAIEKKEIELGAAHDAVGSLGEIPKSALGIRGFISMHFDVLQGSGHSLKTLYQFLKSKGVDVGTFGSFRVIYWRVKRKRASAAEGKAKPTQASAPQVKAKIGEKKEQENVEGYRLKPVTLPDGTAIEIDLETGARTFKI